MLCGTEGVCLRFRRLELYASGYEQRGHLGVLLAQLFGVRVGFQGESHVGQVGTCRRGSDCSPPNVRPSLRISSTT